MRILELRALMGASALPRQELCFNMHTFFNVVQFFVLDECGITSMYWNVASRAAQAGLD